MISDNCKPINIADGTGATASGDVNIAASASTSSTSGYVNVVSGVSSLSSMPTGTVTFKTANSK